MELALSNLGERTNENRDADVEEDVCRGLCLWWGGATAFVDTRLEKQITNSIGMKFALIPAGELNRIKPQPVLLGANAPAAVRSGSEFTPRFVAYAKQFESDVQNP